MMLYIHLPFCKQKCKYCAFCSGDYAKETQSNYIEQIIKALDKLVQGKEVKTVYIGGGTPSALPLDLWKKLLGAIHRYVDCSALKEFTVECNPESTNEALLQVLKSGGVGRLSFGVQSLDDRELAAIGRLHRSQRALAAIELAQKCGFSNIGADLIYGLPHQTPESFQRSLQTLLGCGITHLSCYNLQLEEGTKLFSEQNSLPFPSEEEQMEMYELLCSITAKAGFTHYEISNFCKQGFRAVHNSGYWTGEDYIGLGAAAHSKIGNKRYSFKEDVSAFIAKNEISFDECVELSAQDIGEETIMLGLRTDGGAPIALLDEQKVARFVQMGLGEIKNENFVLNERGFILSNSIIADLI